MTGAHIFHVWLPYEATNTRTTCSINSAHPLTLPITKSTCMNSTFLQPQNNKKTYSADRGWRDRRVEEFILTHTHTHSDGDRC